MSLRIVALEPEHLAAVARFSEKTWDRPWTPEFVHWRYVEAPGHRVFLTMRGDECLATLSVFSRPYRLGAELAICLETADWYCLPELRLSGLGIRLMRRVMEEPHLIVSVGGSADTRRLLPRLGWQRVGEATEFALWLGGRTASGSLARGRGTKAFVRRLPTELASRWLGPPRVPTPPGAETLFVECPGPELERLYTAPIDCGTVPLPLPDQLAWLRQGFGGSRQLVATYFRREAELAGWSLLRLDATAAGIEALLLELFSPGAHPAQYAWMVAETVARARAAGAAWIRAQASFPPLQAALRRNQFVERCRWPVHVWRQAGPLPPEPFHFCFNTGDAPLLPYPSRWAARRTAEPS